MDYSKWKKFLIILTIINLIWIFYNRVFASSDLTCEFENVTYTLPEDTYNIPSDYAYKLIFLRRSIQTDNSSDVCAWYCYSDAPIVASSSNSYFQLHFSSSHNIINVYNLTTSSWFSKPWFSNKNTSFEVLYSRYSYEVAYSSDDISLNNNVIIPATPDYLKPQFAMSDQEIQTLDFSDLYINPYDYGFDNNLYFKVLEVTNVVTDEQNQANNIYYYNDLTFKLNKKSRYYKQWLDVDYYFYSLPYSALKLKKDKTYYFILTDSDEQFQQTVGEITENDNIFDVVLCDTENIVTTSDEILNSIINDNPSQNTDDNINNNLPRPSLNDSNNNINIPGMNVNIPDDVTTTGFNYIFTSIYNAVNSEPVPINFHLPFVNYDFTIDPLFLQIKLEELFTVDVAGGYRNIVLDLIYAFYYFIFSYYIFNDIRKTIEKVKTGDIMTHTDTNIKADML